MKVWELERTTKSILKIYTRDRILVDNEAILAEYSCFSYNDYSGTFTQDDIKTDAQNIMLATGAVDGRKQTYTILLVYRWDDRPLYLALIGEDGGVDLFDYESKRWQQDNKI